MNDIHANNKIISDWSIESDSRGEIGTPELASRIFAKIDQCDIFVAENLISFKGLSRCS